MIKMKRLIYKILKIVPDKIFLKIKYRLKTGRKLNLKNPQTYNEKLQWLKLYDRKDIYTTLVDKYEVKDYISKIIGDEYIIPTLGVYDNFDDIDFDSLPNEFVIKCTHDSGGLVIVKDKNNFDKEAARKKINASLKNNYYLYHREWPYKNVSPRIIVEKMLECDTNGQLPDYKFFCFDGKVRNMFVAVDRPNATKFNFYDSEFNKLNVSQHYPNFDYELEKPSNFEKMIELCEKISRNLKHVRVDLYNINGKIYFGEITFYHFGGFEKFSPENFDYEMGKFIDLKK